MAEQGAKLKASETALTKVKAENEDLKKRLAAAETANKNVTKEFQTFKTSNEKQRQATMATLAGFRTSSKKHENEILALKKKNLEVEADCKEACDRLKAIADDLEKVESNLSGMKK